MKEASESTNEAGKEEKERKEGEKLISHKVPVDVSEEGVAHDVSKACLRVAAQTLLGVLRGLKVKAR